LKKKFRTFEDARKFVHALKLKNAYQWRKYSSSDKRPEDIPSTPPVTYKNKGWVSWGDWLGTGAIAMKNKKHRSFDDARKFVLSLGLRSYTEWNAYCISGNKPDDIPSAPWNTYKKSGWISTGHWLGTGRVADQLKQYRPFSDARAFVHSLGLKGQKEWSEYCKSGNKPEDIPYGVSKTYKKDWKGWGDWLGTGNISNVTKSKRWRPFKEAREFAHSLKLKGMNDWYKYCKSGKKPDDIPANPDTSYKNKGWISNGDWFGTGIVASYNKIYRPFPEAKKFIRSLGLKNQKEWKEYCMSGKKPDDIPSNPWVTYSKKHILRRKNIK